MWIFTHKIWNVLRKCLFEMLLKSCFNLHVNFFQICLMNNNNKYLTIMSRAIMSLPLLEAHGISTGYTRKHNTVLNSWQIGHSYLAQSFILRKEEVPVCVACNAVITVKHILTECSDLLEIRKKYLEEGFLYLPFPNVIPKYFLTSCERLVSK